MSLREKVLEMVEIERLYQHVLALEGVRHPLSAPDALNQAGQYIENYFQQIGLPTELHWFSVDGLDEDFYNVVATLNAGEDPSQPTMLISSHFDTTPISPGADDNGSAIAIMLEVARILKVLDYDKKVIFVSFNLEEASSAILKRIRETGRSMGMLDEQYRYISHRMKLASTHFQRFQYTTLLAKGFLDENDWQEFSTKILQKLPELSSQELQFFKETNAIYQSMVKGDAFGQSFVLGSSAYADLIVQQKIPILGLINLETIGYTSDKPHSQSFAPGTSLDMFETFRIDSEIMKGDFVLVIGDHNSETLARSYFANAKQEDINVPSVLISMPLKFEALKQSFPDLLRSDHAPFWKYDIPALMITDTANFRNPHYHTRSDTIDTLDFDFMVKVCQTTLATVIDMHNLKD
ncbi:MAG: M28 family peptidase [Candidatus Hodarchaeales archaeon]|jgi:hypothetical protein